jgi:uncharacterized protein YsxB (DUF464 family)
MIEVELKTRQDSITGLTSRGHAPGSMGNNLLCGSVSTLLQTLLYYLKREKLIETFQQSSGFLDVSLIGFRNPRMELILDQAFNFVVLGLELLKKEYPGEIDLRKVEEGNK